MPDGMKRTNSPVVRVHDVGIFISLNGTTACARNDRLHFAKVAFRDMIDLIVHSDLPTGVMLWW